MSTLLKAACCCDADTEPQPCEAEETTCWNAVYGHWYCFEDKVTGEFSRGAWAFITFTGMVHCGSDDLHEEGVWELLQTEVRSSHDDWHVLTKWQRWFRSTNRCPEGNCAEENDCCCHGIAAEVLPDASTEPPPPGACNGGSDPDPDPDPDPGPDPDPDPSHPCGGSRCWNLAGATWDCNSETWQTDSSLGFGCHGDNPWPQYGFNTWTEGGDACTYYYVSMGMTYAGDPLCGRPEVSSNPCNCQATLFAVPPKTGGAGGCTC